MNFGTKIKALFFSVCVAFAVDAFAVPELRPMPSLDTLSIWVMDNGIGSQRTLHRIGKKFQKEYGVPVSIRMLNWGEAFDEIGKALAETDSSVKGPDLIQLGSTWVAHFAAAGQIRPMDMLLAKIDTTRFFAECLKTTHIADNSTSYSVPWFLDVRGLFVNERLWKNLEVQEQDVDTYPKFMGVLRAISQAQLKNGKGMAVAPFAIAGKNDWDGPQQMAPIVWSYGGDFIVKDGDGFRSALIDPSTLQGLAIFATIMGDYQLAPHSLEMNSAQSAEKFVASEQLLLYGTSELIRQLEFPEDAGGLKSSEIAGDGLSVIPFPAGPAGHISLLGGSHLALPSRLDSARAKLAEDLLLFLFRADNIDAYSRQLGFLPSDQGIVHIWKQDARYSKLIENLKSSRSFPNIPEWGAVENILNRLSNEMGALLSKTKLKEERNRGVAHLILSAHNQINAVLGNDEKVDEEHLLPQVISLLADVPEEIVPQHLNVVQPKPESPVKQIVLGAVILLIVGALVLVIRIAKKRL